MRERGQTQLGTFGAQRPVGGDVRDVPGVAQHLLASLHLAGQAGVDAFDEAGVVGQVRDDARDLGCAVEGSEGSAALVVDEHHRQILRIVADQQPQHQGAQHLALAGTRRPDAQAVRAHAVLGGLLEIEGNGFAHVIGSDGDPQESGLAARRPRPGEVDVVVVGHPQQFGEGHDVACGVVFVRVRGQTQRAEEMGQGIRRVPVQVIEETGDDFGGGIRFRVGFDHETPWFPSCADPRCDEPGFGPAIVQEVNDRGAHLAQFDLRIRWCKSCGRLAVLVHQNEDAAVLYLLACEHGATGLGRAGGTGVEFRA